MGTLKPGAIYIYEHVDGITYAREQGAPVNTRFEVGRTLDRQLKDTKLADTVLWTDILEESKVNPVLKDAVDKCKIIYYLNKEHGNSKT